MAAKRLNMRKNQTNPVCSKNSSQAVTILESGHKMHQTHRCS